MNQKSPLDYRAGSFTGWDFSGKEFDIYDRDWFSHGCVQQQLLELWTGASVGAKKWCSLDRMRHDWWSKLDSRSRLPTACCHVGRSIDVERKSFKLWGAFFTDWRSVPSLLASGFLTWSGVYQPDNSLGIPCRVRSRGYHWWPLCTKRCFRYWSVGIHEAFLHSGNRDCRTIQDDHRYRTPWILHHQTWIHGKDAGFRWQPLFTLEYGYGKHVHCRAGPRSFPQSIQT